MAAVGTTGAETWYVRPTGACANNGDGLAYECAASAGASGAFIGFSNIIWTTTTGVDDGDTLFVCGDHLTELIPTQSGGATAPITIDGACANDPGSIDTSQDTSSSIDAIDIATRSNITIQRFGAGDYRTGHYSHIGIRSGYRYGIIAFSTNSTQSGIIIRDNVIDNRNASRAAGTCHAVYFSGSGVARWNSSAVVRNVILGTPTGCANGNNDDINLEYVGSFFVVEHNWLQGGNEGLEMSSGDVPGVHVRYNIATNNRVSGMKFHGGNASACPNGAAIYGNVLFGNDSWALIAQDVQGFVVTHNTFVQRGGLDPRETLSVGDVVGNCTVANNVYTNNIIVNSGYSLGAVRVNGTGTKAWFESTHTFNGNTVYAYDGGATPLIYFNNDTGNNVTAGAFATWQGAHPQDVNTDPAFLNVGGADFRLSLGSPLVGAGLPYWPCADVRGRLCNSPPDIGAYQATSGDPAAARAVRQ